MFYCWFLFREAMRQTGHLLNYLECGVWWGYGFFCPRIRGGVPCFVKLESQVFAWSSWWVPKRICASPLFMKPSSASVFKIWSFIYILFFSYLKHTCKMHSHFLERMQWNLAQALGFLICKSRWCTRCPCRLLVTMSVPHTRHSSGTLSGCCPITLERSSYRARLKSKILYTKNQTDSNLVLLGSL